jgi:hypothetical protein
MKYLKTRTVKGEKFKIKKDKIMKMRYNKEK